ncbi:hypothetical protein C1X05_08710 [Laceyella sacchari]|uniref:Uncharacterized protein n=1 Tax=Laceyella sediminis TaxID=573074 RepID=A0ABX5EPV7_9BACL|nr:hypothetical protein [Laceyella sediminis]AUS08918.1 hypothetical protein C1X05_08710 [Laceyella sacchari]PRZ15309.1 hypothetical protein CLV36_10432 [Laceyella sediminis]
MNHSFRLLPGEQATLSCGTSPFLFRIDILIRPHETIRILRHVNGARLERISEQSESNTISVPDRSLVHIRCSAEEWDFCLDCIN